MTQNAILKISSNSSREPKKIKVPNHKTPRANQTLKVSSNQRINKRALRAKTNRAQSRKGSKASNSSNNNRANNKERAKTNQPTINRSLSRARAADRPEVAQAQKGSRVRGSRAKTHPTQIVVLALEIHPLSSNRSSRNRKMVKQALTVPKAAPLHKTG